MAGTKSTTVLAMIGKEGAVIGADRLVTGGYTIIYTNEAHKLTKVDNRCVIGSAGSHGGGKHQRFMLAEHIKKNGVSEESIESYCRARYQKDEHDRDEVMMLVTPEDIWLIWADGDFVKVSGAAAIGAGKDLAIGAAIALQENTDLPIRSIVKKVLSIVATRQVTTNRKFEIVELKTKLKE